MVCLILALQWGGSTYAWSAPRMIGLLVTFAVTFVIFVASFLLFLRLFVTSLRLFGVVVLLVIKTMHNKGMRASPLVLTHAL